MHQQPIKIGLKFILNLLLLLAFGIYIKKLPVEVETQPVFIFIISLFLIPFLKIRINKKDYLLICHLLILIIYGLIQFSLYQTGFLGVVSYLIGPIVYLIFLNRIHYISTYLLKIIIILYTALAVVMLFKIPFLYDLYKAFYDIFLSREIQDDFSGFRGLALLSPEPSYFGFSAILLLALLDIKIMESQNKSLNKFKILLILLALSTKSALVFFYLGLYFLGFFFGGSLIKKIRVIKIKNIFKVSLVLLIAIVPFVVFEKSRPAEVIQNVYQNFDRGTDIERLMLKESSGSTRLIVNGLGFMSLYYAPFGWGIGEFQNNIPVVGQKFHSLLTKHENIKEAYAGNMPLKAQTYLANLTGDIGIFALPLFLFLLSSFFAASNPIGNGLKYVLPLMLIIFQGQISNPCIWISLAILNSKIIFKDSTL